MFRMSIESLTNSLVRSLLQDKTDHNEGEALHFFYDVSLLSRENGKTYERRVGLHLLYCKSYSYIHVFSATTHSQRRIADVAVGGWKHQSSHDSEWKNTRAFSDLYFQMAHDINDARETDGLTSIAPIVLEQNGHTTVGLFQPPFEWVKVHMTKDPTDPCSYRRMIKVLA